MQNSLFTPMAQTPVAASLGWIEGVLFGPVAVIFCVIAVAFVGAAMMTGRLAVRRGALVIVGCFILFGAPIIANALMLSSV